MFFFPLRETATLAESEARMPCSELDDSFLRDGNIIAWCDIDGIWGPLDMSQCTFRADAEVAAVAVVEIRTDSSMRSMVRKSSPSYIIQLIFVHTSRSPLAYNTLQLT